MWVVEWFVDLAHLFGLDNWFWYSIGNLIIWVRTKLFIDQKERSGSCK